MTDTPKKPPRKFYELSDAAQFLRCCAVLFLPIACLGLVWFVMGW